MNVVFRDCHVGNSDGRGDSVLGNHLHNKMMRNIADTYFNDAKLDAMNKTLMVFASYNAGPNRGASAKAGSEGLDPTVCFANVELVVAKGLGQETV